MLNHVDIDIFKRRFVFIPIHDNKHWSMMCVIRPNLVITNAMEKWKMNKTGSTKPQEISKLTENFMAEEVLEDADDSEGIEGEQLPCILFMDSLNIHKMNNYSKPLKS
jgi:Ulp1 family protease